MVDWLPGYFISLIGTFFELFNFWSQGLLTKSLMETKLKIQHLQITCGFKKASLFVRNNMAPWFYYDLSVNFVEIFKESQKLTFAVQIILKKKIIMMFFFCLIWRRWERQHNVIDHIFDHFKFYGNFNLILNNFDFKPNFIFFKFPPNVCLMCSWLQAL